MILFIHGHPARACTSSKRHLVKRIPVPTGYTFIQGSLNAVWVWINHVRMKW